MKRRFLFLQGVISPFFARLSDQLRAEGHAVFRVNFCAGDALDWGRRPGWRFRGRLEELPEFLERKFRSHGVTDLVLFGDQRPVHLPAVALARVSGVRVFVFEEGYVRPNWITLERGGVNANSALPRDPAWYLVAARQVPDYGEGRPVTSRLAARVRHDLTYHMTNLSNPLTFPFYRSHRPHSAAREYAGWVRRFGGLGVRRRRDAERIRDVLDSRRPYFLLPLQLNSDVQIRAHSTFSGMPAVIDSVLRSFAGAAPRDAVLIVKNHPLDTGMIDYGRLIAGLRRELDLAGRVHYIETGHLPGLLAHASGVVTVNSTTGLSALVHRCPTIALGNAIYDLPGLTHQGGLDGFWHHREPPDTVLLRAFRNTVIHTTQVNGGFYDDPGIALALAGSERLLQIRGPLGELLP